MLNDKEILFLYSAIKACHEVSSPIEFKDLISTEIRRVFPHELAACCISEVPYNRVVKLINIDFPREYLREIIRPDKLIQAPITAWIHKQVPLFIKVDEPSILVGNAWLRVAREYNIQNIASHGLIDTSGNISSYFSFAGVHPSAFDKYEELLNMLIPHLHTTLMRQFFRSRASPKNVNRVSDSYVPSNFIDSQETHERHELTQRERQILDWVRAGKTNWEIACILNISENTVKKHVQNMYKKLDVTNRIQAVARAVFD